MLYSTLDDVNFTLSELPFMTLPAHVLMTTPAHFDVKYVINPHMTEFVGQIDQNIAMDQWRALRDTYTQLGFPPRIIEGRHGLPDMVFCANQTLPFFNRETGKPGIVLSQMFAPQRKGEVPFYAGFFEALKYEVVHLPLDEETAFEGTGDAIWHPGRALLWGGYGFRTDAGVYEELAQALDVRVLLLELQDPEFYHLDTCFCALDEHTVLICPEAFTPKGRGLIRTVFPNVIEAPAAEARHGFACNAHSPNGKHVIIHETCTETMHMLRDAGYIPVAVDTSEFIKAGGSVFCMKLMHW